MKRLNTRQSLLGFAVALFFVTLVSFNIVQVFSVESTITPSVPEFTVTYVAHPYDVPSKTTTYTDPFTGKETVTEVPGYHVENRSIEVVIDNQFFRPYTDDEGNEMNLYYLVRAKGHFGDDWELLIGDYLVKIDLEYSFFKFSAKYPEGGLVDFQVRAAVGYKYNTLAGRPAPPIYELHIVESSEWSPTQTLTIQNPEIIPEFPSWTILPLFVSVATVVVVCRNRLNKPKKNGVCSPE